MKKKLLFSSIIVFSIWNVAYAQTDNKVETKFIRPSIVNLFNEPANAREATIIKSFKELKMISKFNDHSINYSNLKYNLPASPNAPDYSKPADVKAYNKRIAEIDSMRRIQFRKYLDGASNLIVAKWWNRNSNGDFNTDLISERGTFTATDADVIANKAAAVNRIQEMGLQLIDKTYAIVYTISNVQNMEEVYNAMDEAGKKQKDYKPVKRTEEGYQLNYSASLYKLNFGDSVSAVFYNNYWSDAKNHDAKKVQDWNSASFPMTLILSKSGSASATQSNDPNSYKFSRRKSMDELLVELPSQIQDDAITKMSRKVNDFRVKAPVFQEKPLAAKLGTKESLYVDERFFAYEIALNKDGKQVKKRKGVARASKIANNDTISTGDTKPSIFKQQGGKKLYQGMLLEAKEDFGIIITAGYRMNSSDLSMAGISAGLEANISKLAHTAKSIPGGILFGASITFNSMKDVKTGNITTPKGLSTGTKVQWNGSTMALDITLSKEMYFTPKGNIYIMPSIAYGFTSMTLSQLKVSGSDKYDSISVYFGTSYNEKDWSWGGSSYQVGLGIGVNLLPNVSLMVKPMFVMKSAYTTGNNEKLTQTNIDKDISTKWGFDKIDKSNISIPIFLYLKIRL